MGVVTSAMILHRDGSMELLADATAPASRDDGQVELHYAYGPGLLPPELPSFDGMWRYRGLLPLDDGPIGYPLPVGGTPLVAPRLLRRQANMPHLWLKDETRTPTGSNKDRATALVLEQAVRSGARTVTCASTGNVAVSLAVGAAATGLRAVLFVPADTSASKLQLMLLAGATVVKVRDGYEAAFTLSRRAARAFGWHDRNTGVNPLTLEAKKTVALEIWEQLGRSLPDVVVAPVGDGVTLCALAKGFRELQACGIPGRLPRLIGVQAEGCQPLAHAWRVGGPLEAIESHTIADGIAVGAPFGGPMALRDVRETGGGFVTVSDASMLRAIGTLAASGGILAEPAGAAAFAGVDAAADGLIGRDELVVALVTGTGLKNLQYLQPSSTPHEVQGTLDEVERIVQQI
jgi:threonine synthase